MNTFTKHKLLSLLAFIASHNLCAQGQTSQNTRMLEAYLPDAITHYNQAVDFQKVGRNRDAIAEYKIALAADNRMAEAWCNLASIYETKKSYALAIDALEQSLVLTRANLNSGKPFGVISYCLSLSHLATLYSAEGDYAHAEPLYKEVLRLGPVKSGSIYSVALQGYIRMLRKMKRFSAAEELESQMDQIEAR